MTTAVEKTKRDWLSVREQGSIWGLQFFVFVVSAMGRTVARFWVWLIMPYYFLAARTARRATADFLRRIEQPSGWGAVFRQFVTFSHCVVDKILLLRGETEAFDLELIGHEHMESLQGRGALLLSAHVGSFEALRAAARDYDMVVNIIVNRTNARMVNKVFSDLETDGKLQLVEMGDDQVKLMLRLRELVEMGQTISIMGDRVTAGERSMVVPFLGQDARFPTGAYLLAHALKCPVFLVFGIYEGGNKYTLHCEPFAEQIRLPRKGRQDALKGWVDKYSERLEHYARRSPSNWWNFFDFWRVD